MKTGTGKERLDIDQKILALILFGITCAVLLIFLVNISINTSSALRAYVAGEAYWAKAQKEAVIHLNHYILTEKEVKYEHFYSVLRINFGDERARKELLKQNFNYQVAYEGMLQGKNHPDDIPHMITMFRRFQWVPAVQEALQAWQQGDEKIAELTHFADSVHATISEGTATQALKAEWLEYLVELDHELTTQEVRFANTMGNMARQVNGIFRWSTIVFGLMLIGMGAWLTYRFMRSTSVWAETLRESEDRFRNMLNNSRDVLYKMDIKTKKYKYVSPALEKMLGYKPEELEEKGVIFILNNMHPDDKERMQKVVDKYNKAENDHFLPSVEFRLKNREGNWVWISNARSLVHDPDGNPEAIVGSVRDISTRKEQEEQIKKSLQEKEILLQEIHHRVKNNLSIISSMLELQKEGMTQEVQDMLASSQSRIKSIAKVHEKLYKSTNLSDISMDVYIAELTEEITKAYASEKQHIEVTVDAEPFSMKTESAIPFGLVLNELINNAYKHGFKNVDEGKIRVSFKRNDHKMELRVENTGGDSPAHISLGESDSLGMTLIQVLIKRFNGEIELQTDDWTRFIITFDAEKLTKVAD